MGLVELFGDLLTWKTRTFLLFRLHVPIETGTLLFPISLCCPPSPRMKPNQYSSARTHLSKPFSWPHVSLVAWKPNRFRGRTVFFGGNSNDISNESRFLDENGVVDDMDGYLNYLSLEYDSVWDTRTSW